MHLYTNCAGPKGALSNNVATLSAESEVKIAIVVFAGFSVKEVDALADIFSAAHLCDPAEEGAPLPERRFNVSLLSIGGGYVADSLSIPIWTDSIESRLEEKFDGVFMVGAKCKVAAAEDPEVLRAVLTLVGRAHVVVWDSDSALYRFVMTSTSTAQRGRRLSNRSHSRLSPSVTEAAVSFVVARVLTSAQARKQIESRILVHLTSSRSAVRVDASTWPPVHRGDAPSAGISSPEWTMPIRAGANWLRENYMRPISVAHAADIANMSERTFLRRFRAETAMTPSEYLLGIRLRAVCGLLRQTRLPVNTIARRCGMGNGERLAKIFRRRLSLTPSEYRDSDRREIVSEVTGSP